MSELHQPISPPGNRVQIFLKGRLSILPYVPHVWDDIQEELLSQFRFSTYPEALQFVALFLEEVEDLVLIETDRVTYIDGADMIHLAIYYQFVEDLHKQKFEVTGR